jgi:hypothetical protein
MWDPEKKMWRLWYSAGEQYEPNAIGYSTSTDGFHSEQVRGQSSHDAGSQRNLTWESQRVTAAQIIPWKGWHYSFYIGFRDIDQSQIGLARSKDGITNWVRHAGNPIVRPMPGGWDGCVLQALRGICKRPLDALVQRQEGVA